MLTDIDIFVSYKREERDIALSVSRAIQNSGYSVVTDLNVQNADDFDETIDLMIGAAKLVVVLWTPMATKSRWVRKEASEAERLGKYFGVVVKSVEPEDLPLSVRTNQFLDISKNTPSGDFFQLTQEIGRIVGPPSFNAKEAVSRSATLNGDLEFFQVANAVDDVSGYKAYLRVYPKGNFVEAARNRIRALTKWYVPYLKWAPSAAALTVLVSALGVYVSYINASRDVQTSQEVGRDVQEGDRVQEELESLRSRVETVASLQVKLDEISRERNKLNAELASANADMRALKNELESLRGLRRADDESSRKTDTIQGSSIPGTLDVPFYDGAPKPLCGGVTLVSAVPKFDNSLKEYTAVKITTHEPNGSSWTLPPYANIQLKTDCAVVAAYPWEYQPNRWGAMLTIKSIQ